MRGAAIALCMSVDELRQLLDGRCDKVKASDSTASESENAEKLKQLRTEVAFLKSENARLSHELSQRNEAFKALSDFIVVKF